MKLDGRMLVMWQGVNGKYYMTLAEQDSVRVKAIVELLDEQLMMKAAVEMLNSEVVSWDSKDAPPSSEMLSRIKLENHQIRRRILEAIE